MLLGFEHKEASYERKVKLTQQIQLRIRHSSAPSIRDIKICETAIAKATVVYEVITCLSDDFFVH
jgi:hypothetical protein